MSYEALVILSKLEQEYLLHAIEAALPVQERRQFFLWSQGPLQALLPHQLMVCLQFGPGDVLQHLDTLHSVVLEGGLLARICNPLDGLALRLARTCRIASLLPAWLDASGSENLSPLDAYLGELRDLGLDNVMLHGNGRTAGQDTVFLLFNLPQRPRARHGYFFSLLLPTLHLTLLRLNQWQAQDGVLARPVTAREREILHWVREGKSNEEIGLILGISGLTVKNHLQHLYRLLGVSNRTHAIARGMALLLFEQPPAPLARVA
ncbi:LuxR C-terminal-related transcriptional regulator [Pseudoduganella danionis]|uniref:Helix-turn-helix transcriptional regulator n=1 Tax=Pseudoduganella danionis TaxID=1890295 RepID=A0ABW9SP87_9BURK|nr:LuxR C-terminal-related transcriptional regulator [Pseudoduganella danionis]MTW33409.1 helix-turn-helix transcriptional regulator [Pseudoduganella danionis]